MMECIQCAHALCLYLGVHSMYCRHQTNAISQSIKLASINGRGNCIAFDFKICNEVLLFQEVKPTGGMNAKFEKFKGAIAHM